MCSGWIPAHTAALGAAALTATLGVAQVHTVHILLCPNHPPPWPGDGWAGWEQNKQMLALLSSAKD